MIALKILKACRERGQKRAGGLDLDEAITELEETMKQHEAQLEAKDEYIKTLECRAYHAEGYISDLHNHPKDKKFYDAKARSIVAMLFWEWKKSEREAKIERYDDWENGVSFGEDKKAEELFKKAYAMLKDKA